MCWMFVKEADSSIPTDYMDKAQKHNSDGYGVAWYEDGLVKTYKTFNYVMFKKVLSTLEDKTIVVHLRYATKGKTSYNNIHPFEIPSGVMFHNGTMFRLPIDRDDSDTAALAKIITKCDYKFIEDIKPLIEPIVDDKINRLVFFEDNGQITIINKNLGIEEDGVWYSNDYHLKNDSWCRHGGCITNYELDIPKPKVKELERNHKVFVYGTLKRGYSNHKLLQEAIFLGKAETSEKWNMIGANMAFPYVMEKDNDKGSNIKGEVYIVSDAELSSLDRLEGVPHHYIKKTIVIKYLDDMSEDTATIYTKAHIAPDYTAKNKLISEWIK